MYVGTVVRRGKRGEKRRREKEGRGRERAREKGYENSERQRKLINYTLKR